MKLAIWQLTGVPGVMAANLALLAEGAAQAAADGAELVVFPELFLGGYNIGGRVHDLAEPADGPAMQAVGEVARRCGLAILTGYPERVGAVVYNAAALVDRSGARRLNYRKAHLFGDYERGAFAAGDGFPVADLGGLRLGVLICYDIEFPEAARTLAKQGAQAILVPTALPADQPDIPQVLVPARALENRLYVAWANRCGGERGLTYLGRSRVLDPDGRTLAMAGSDSAMITVTLDPTVVEAARAVQDYLADRRPDEYGEEGGER